MSAAQQPETASFPEGVAVVFGGSGGIGRAICTALARRGCDVALSYRSNRDTAESVVAQVQDLQRRAEAVQLELADAASVAATVSGLQQKYGRIHTVVFATGADIRMTHVANVEMQEWRAAIDGDLHGFFHVVKATLPLMRAGGGGSFVAITSAGIDRHPPLDILSVAPKAGVEALVRGIAREEGRFGIRANSVAPGVIDGGLFLRLTPQVTPEFVEAMKRNTALRRFGTVQEIANVAVFLASADAAYVTGQHIAVDGGYSV